MRSSAGYSEDRSLEGSSSVTGALTCWPEFRTEGMSGRGRRTDVPLQGIDMTFPRSISPDVR
jgi:hypothetical protein